MKSQGAVITGRKREILARKQSISVSTSTLETALISGIVYKDENGDGIYESGKDIAIPGAMVSVWRGGEFVSATYTDENGAYSISLPAGGLYILKVGFFSDECYNPAAGKWGLWSSIEGQRKNVVCPALRQDISVKYRMLDYGAKDFSWELWHKGPLFNVESVVLIHGFRLPGSTIKGRCDGQFRKLDDLLQTREDLYNVWQFEYAEGSRGTPDSVATYASRLGKAINRIGELTGKNTCSMIGYSMGGIIARYYIAASGKHRVSKLLTLATPHMGTLVIGPFDLKQTGKLLPRASLELRPDSRLLWDLNTKVDPSVVPEFAAIGGYSWGRTDGVIEMGSTSLVKSNPDGSVAERFYFAGVKRSHGNINFMKDKHDEVFQLILSFLRGGSACIAGFRVAEEPGEYNAKFFLTFALKENPKQRKTYPAVVVSKTRRCYRGFRVFSQGARTEDGSAIFAAQMQSGDGGEARIYYGKDKYATVLIHEGQTTLVTKPVGANSGEN